MYTRRSPFRTLILVGLGILAGALLFGGAGAAEAVVAAPFIILGFLFKVALIALFIGFVAKAVGGHRRWDAASKEEWIEEMRKRRNKHRTSREQGTDEKPSAEDRFAEWHRMAHAREEVDDHVPPVED